MELVKDEIVDRIQKQLHNICISDYANTIHEDIWDYLRNIQHCLNDARNNEFKSTEPDPFA